MLTANSTLHTHRLQDLTLILLSLSLLPITTPILILILALLYSHLRNPKPLRWRCLTRSNPEFKPRTILVTGVGMTKGLSLARLFHQAGHTVIGADFEPGGALVCGRVSRAVRRFYRLIPPSEESGSEPYVQGLLDVVRKEGVELWVSCSGVASAVEDGLAMQIVEARTRCRAVQFDAETTRVLHEKHSFIERVGELGLSVPETHVVTSSGQVEDVLQKAPGGRKYILKTVGMDDSVRADMTLLPGRTHRETAEHIARLRISEKSPWIVQQFIDGLEFCTHSLVVRGQVKAFVACPSAELLMHYEALPDDSPLTQAMLKFTNTFAENSGTEFTGHLSFDFLVEREDLTKDHPEEITLYPIECNPRAHTAVALFAGAGSGTELVDAYLSVLDNNTQHNNTKVKPNSNASYAAITDPNPTRRVITPNSIAYPTPVRKYYWTGNDLVAHFILPLFRALLLHPNSWIELIKELDLLVDRVLTWHDGTFETWDPMPWWWLYHVYWPWRLLVVGCKGTKWSRVNVSTGKMFEC